MNIIWLDETTSTNSYITENYCQGAYRAAREVVAVATKGQTAGRGQRGNSWESEPGQNLTFSILWRPEGIAPHSQFVISEAVALAVVNYLSNLGVEASVKWPNDIYVGDRKICGILIEHSVMGQEIEYTIIGVGLNVNQKSFSEELPNPVSFQQLTSMELELHEQLPNLVAEIERMLQMLGEEEQREWCHEEFKCVLWRGDGAWYPFSEREGATKFDGRIVDVEPCGLLAVEVESSGEVKKYAFKEVEFLLEP